MFGLVVVDQNENVVQVYAADDSPLLEVRDALRMQRNCLWVPSLG